MSMLDQRNRDVNYVNKKQKYILCLIVLRIINAEKSFEKNRMIHKCQEQHTLSVKTYLVYSKNNSILILTDYLSRISNYEGIVLIRVM